MLPNKQLKSLKLKKKDLIQTAKKKIRKKLELKKIQHIWDFQKLKEEMTIITYLVKQIKKYK